MKNSDIQFGLFEKSDSDEQKLTHLESISHELTFHNLLIDCKTHQKFTNRSEKVVELLYKYRSFMAPHDLKVSLFDPETKKREVLVAKIHTKQKAIERYDDAVAIGNRAVLMEKDEETENLYVLSLGSIKPKMEIEITTQHISTAILETDEEDPDRVTFLHSIPSMIPESMDLGGRSLEENMMVEIFAENALTVISPSHSDALTKVGEGRWKTSSEEKVTVDEEFEIEVSFVKYPFSTFHVSHINFKRYKYAGILSLIPNFAAQPPYGSELILIVDCSGSMSGSRIKCAVETLRLFMASLDPDRNIRYNIIRFGTRFEKLFPESVKLEDDKNFKKAKKYVKQMRANLGGTNMYLPICSVFGKEKKDGKDIFRYDDDKKTDVYKFVADQEEDKNRLKEKKYQKQLFLFTDGEDSYTTKIENYLKEKYEENKVRVFSFGIGRGINKTFLQNCADLTNGSACFIEDIRVEMKAKVLRQLSNSFRASINDISISSGLCDGTEGIKRARTIENVRGVGTKQNKLPSLFNGRIHHEYFFLENLPTEDVVVDYRLNDFVCSEKVEVEILSEEEQLQEQQQQEEEEEEGVEKKKEKIGAIGIRVANEMVKISKQDKKAVEEIGLHFNIPTEHTSFCMISEEENEEKIVSEMVVEEVKFKKKKREAWSSSRRGRGRGRGKWGGRSSGRPPPPPMPSSSGPPPPPPAPSSSFPPPPSLSPPSPTMSSGSSMPPPPPPPSEGLALKGALPPADRNDRGRLFSEIRKGKNGATKFKLKKISRSAMRRPKSPKTLAREMNSRMMGSGVGSMGGRGGGGGGMMAALMSRRRTHATQSSSNSYASTHAARSCFSGGGFSSSFGGGGGGSVAKLDDDESSEEEEEMDDGDQTKKTDVKGSINQENLNELLLQCGMKGLWKFTLTVLKRIGFFSKSAFLKESKKTEDEKDLHGVWLTCVIIAILQKFYKRKKSEWKLIVRKSMKALRKEKNGNKLLEEAKVFVSGL